MPAFNHPCSRLRYGFTLIEVLIVVCVIAILCAILLPVMSRVRDTAKTTVCASNLRQIGIALEMYANDNKYYPPAPAPDNCSWADKMVQYVKSNEVFECPLALDGEYRPGCGPSETKDELIYHFNGSYLLNNLTVDLNGRQLSQSRLKNPSGTLLVLDGNSPLGWTGASPNSALLSPKDIEEMGVELRHNEGSNVLFADGHVKRLRLQILMQPSIWKLSGYKPS
ncbi:MAG TPA: prepilin-type N-terminal cleavage/methylation domain-containing protein [Abditibacteriaceae bacterium]|jgi:prepilin-type processing-associated H-X9-DG protein/prepilin-type N-terminal cleavage/methylation domain-containing protein